MKFQLALAQYPIERPSSPLSWQKHVADFCSQAQKAQMLCLPEYGSLDLTGLLTAQERELQNQVFHLQKHLPLFMETYQQVAKSHSQWVVAPSFPVLENSRVVNRTYLFSPQGHMQFIEKQKMTRFETEDWKIESSLIRLEPWITDFGPVGINICYDVEFPRFASELSRKGVELLLVPSCTETLQGLNRIQVGARARALENQFFVGTSHTVGSAPWSPAVDFNTGEVIFCGPPDLGFSDDGVMTRGRRQEPGWTYVEVDFKKVHQVRKHGSVLNWKDSQS